jgi:hypothetical protein
VSTVSCTTVREAAAELALDLLDGDERAAALAHLETCPACRDEVASLTRAADELLLLAPEAEPDPGLEATVLARVGELADPAPAAEPAAPVVVAIDSRRPRRGRRRLLAAAAAVVLVAAAATVALAGRAGGPGPAAAAPVASMRTAATGQVVGSVRLARAGDDAVVSIPDWVGLVRRYGGAVGATYWLQVRTTGGDHDLHRLPPADQRPWHIALGADPGTVRSVSVVDDAGTVWCTARFTT